MQLLLRDKRSSPELVYMKREKLDPEMRTPSFIGCHGNQGGWDHADQNVWGTTFVLHIVAKS